MSAAAAALRRAAPDRLPLVLVALGFLCVAYGVVGGALRSAGPLGLLLLAAAVVLIKPVWTWRHLLVGLLLVIMYIPIRRYGLPGSLPFQLEPYRLYVMLLVGVWCLALLADPSVRLRKTGFEASIGLVVAVIVASELANPHRVDSLSTPVLKTMTFFVSFILIVYVLTSLLTSLSDVELLVRTLVSSGAIIAVFAIVESRTGYNVFDHLSQVLPFLKATGVTDLARGGHSRAFGPAQHPIALGAALVMLVPLGLYVATTSRSRAWQLAAALLILGSLATLSRTSVVMLFVIVLFFLWFRPRETRRLWPLLIPIVLATHFVLPGTLGTFEAYFLPSGGIVQQQTQINVYVNKSDPTWCNVAPRLARLKPMLDEASQKPIFGWGYGTRITDGPGANTCVLDDQWLGTLVETGSAGIASWWLLIGMFVLRCARAAKSDRSRPAWLLGAIGTSVASFAVGMFFFDAFSFIQVTFLFFVLLAVGAVVLRMRREEAAARVTAPIVAAATPRSG